MTAEDKALLEEIADQMMVDHHVHEDEAMSHAIHLRRYVLSRINVGRQEVVEWIQANSENIYSNDTRSSYVQAINKSEWKAQLKEWGLDEPESSESNNQATKAT